MKPTASVVIPVHNGERVLAEQLAALASQADAPPFEVLVVLNRCTDHSGLVADAYQSRLHLTTLQANERLSASYTRNVGAAVAAAPYLLFCDADDRVGARWVREMVRALADTDADFVGGRPLTDRCNLPNWIYDAFYRDTDGDGLNLHYPGLRYPITASFGITRAAFEAVAGFDDSFPGTGHEEIDLTVRLARGGYRVGVSPRAELLYRPRTTFRGLMKQRRGYAIGGAYSLLKEGTPLVPQSLFEEAKLIVRTVGRLVVRERQWRPTALAAHALDEWFRFDATRRLPNERLTGPTPAEPVLDFTVDPASPVIGGLALLAPVAQAYRNATEGVGDLSLALLDELLRPGDVFLDVAAGIGAFTLFAALSVGASGHVISVEPDPRARDLLVRNLARHGVIGHVSVVAMFDGDTMRGDEQLSLARIDTGRATDAALLEPFDPDRWSLWVVDEHACTATRRRSADALVNGCALIALPASRDREVEAAIERLR